MLGKTITLDTSKHLKRKVISMIYITGDTHGNIDFSKLKRYFSNRYVSKKDYLIILGDAGIVWSKKDCFIWDYALLGLNVLFIDGNHENFELLNRFPVVEYKGAKCHRIYRNIYHIIRGEIIYINGLSFFCMGGATSIDKAQRINHISWWEEENISNKDILNGLDNLEKVNYQVDYVLSHAAPSFVVRKMFNYQADSNSEILEKFQSQINFKKWYFGHYHENKKWNKYRCFYGDILEIPAMDVGKKKVSFPYIYSDENGHLRNWKTGRRISAKVEDLPEWYYEGYYGYYYSLKGVTDVAFRRSLTSNHLDKDAAVYLHYHGKMKKNKFYEPFEEDRSEKWDASTWRESCKRVCLGIEKYSPHLNLNKLKAAINLNYDHYNQRWELLSFSNPDIVIRPFTDVGTPHYVDTHSLEKAKYVVLHGNRVLSEFLKLEYAIRYASIYMSKSLGIEVWTETIGGKDTPFVRAFDTGHNTLNWVYIKEIKYDEN